MRIKEKLAIFDVKGCYWAMTDLLKLYDKEHTGEEKNDQYYLFYVKKLLHNYERELALTTPSGVKQLDLEESIKEIQNDMEKTNQERT